MWSRVEKVRARLLQWLHHLDPDDILILTLTFKDREISAVEAQKRFDSLWSNAFGKRVAGRYFRVLQYQRVRWWVGEHYGTPHYHLIVVLPGIRKGSHYHSDDGTWTQGPALRELEALFEEKHQAYGFGPQHRFEPLRNDYPVKAAVSYIVRYLKKGIKDATGRTVFAERESWYPSEWSVVRRKVVKIRKVVPRSHTFGQRALRVGACTTLLSGGNRKRAIIGTYCVNHGCEMDGIADRAVDVYPWMRPNLALRAFWSDVLVPYYLWSLEQPF